MATLVCFAVMCWSVQVLRLLMIPANAAAAAGVQQSFQSMYAFGDSLTDTGNYLLYKLSMDIDVAQGHLPFGETFFHHPTGRFSDGRLAVDFLAQRVGVREFLAPYLGLNNTQINDGNGPSLVNFAVGGATAQTLAYLNATYNISSSIPYSIDKQLQWFSTLPISENKEALSKALIFFGQIGVNDYFLALIDGLTIDNVITKFVPNVCKVIWEALEFLIKRGAKYLVVEGSYPIGCTSVTRVLPASAITNEYGCAEEVQRISEVQDKLLKEVIRKLLAKYNEDVHITFFDQRKAFIDILKHPSHYGFANTTDPCFDAPNAKLCQNPKKYVSWDDVHFTEAANKALLNLVYTPGFVRPYPNFLTQNH